VKNIMRIYRDEPRKLSRGGGGGGGIKKGKKSKSKSRRIQRALLKEREVTAK